MSALKCHYLQYRSFARDRDINCPFCYTPQNSRKQQQSEISAYENLTRGALCFVLTRDAGIRTAKSNRWSRMRFTVQFEHWGWGGKEEGGKAGESGIGDRADSKHWFTTSFHQPLPYLVVCQPTSSFFVGAQTVVTSLQTTRMISDVCFINDHVAYASSN